MLAPYVKNTTYIGKEMKKKSTLNIAGIIVNHHWDSNQCVIMFYTDI